MPKRKPNPTATETRQPAAVIGKKQNKKKKGRPSFEFTREIGDNMCELIASGKSLTDVCKLDGMPGRTTVYKWLRKHSDFANDYARASEDRADLIADEVLAIADLPGLDPNDKRVRIDARKWWASKVNPKRYGDRTELTGANGGPIELKTDGTDLETARRVAFMLGRAIGKQSPPLMIDSVQNAPDSYACVPQSDDAQS